MKNIVNESRPVKQNNNSDESVLNNEYGNVKRNTTNKRSPFIIVSCIILTLAGILAAMIIADAVINANRVHAGVDIIGIDEKGKNRNDLKKSLSYLEKAIRGNSIKVILGKKSWSINARDIDVSIDKDATIKEAMAYGRTGSATTRLKTRFELWFKSIKVKPKITTNKNKSDLFIVEIAKSIEKMPEDAEIKIVDGRAVATTSKNGISVNKKVLIDDIVDGIMQSKNRVIIPVFIVKPDIQEENLESTLLLVKQMVKEPIILQYRKNSWSISTEDLTKWIEFEKVRLEDIWNLEAQFDKDQVSAFIEQNTKEIVIEPKDAEFKIEEDKVAIVPGRNGTMVDLDKAYDDINNICISDADRIVMLVTTTKEPKLTTEDATKMGIKEKVSGYSTTFSSRKTSRVHNIRTLGAALDGTILAPNQKFSFNETIGPRTAAKGYREAPAIINGELVPSLGGGVCQVATTLFNTIFFGGFEVVERRNHSFYISHYPTGRDATVSWGGPDLKFKNDSGSYLLIKVMTTPGSITIDFFGTKRNIEVDYKTVGPTNYRSSTTKTIKDPNLPKGEKKVIEKGYSGRDVTVYRTVTLDGDVYKKDTFTSIYSPKRTIVRVGIGENTEPVSGGNDVSASDDTQEPQETTEESQEQVSPVENTPEEQ